MPDFGLTEALAGALKAAKSAEVMRPGEQKLAARAAQAAPGAAAPAVPAVAPEAARPVASAPLSAVSPPGSVQAPPIDPSMPPPPVPAADAAASLAPADTSAQAPQEVAATTADGAPPVASPAVSQEPPQGTVPPAPTAAVNPENAVLPPPVSPTVQAAQDFVKANIGDFEGKLDMTHMPNVDTMSSPDQVKATILKVADDNKAAIETSRRGTITDEQMIGLAQDLAVNTDVVRQVLARTFGEQAQRPEVLLAARMVEQNQAGMIYSLAGKIADATATNQEITQFEQLNQQYIAYRTQLSGAVAEQGRGMRAMGIQVGMGLPSEVLDHISNVIQQNNPDLQQMAAAIKMAGTPQGIATILHGSLATRSGKAAAGLLQRVFINGILSGPTFFKILWNNTFNLGVNAADIFAGAAWHGMANLAARIGRYPTAAEGATLEDAVANLHGLISGFADGLRVAGRVLKTGESLDSVMRAKETKTQGTILENIPELQGTTLGSIAKVVDTVVDYPGRVIASVDDFGKTMGYRGYLTMMTMKDVRAQLASGKIKPGDAESVVQKMMENPSDEMEQAAEAWAHRMTFQTPWEVGGAGEAFQKFLNRVPVLRFVFPFMRTATNIFKQSYVERTPFALLSQRLRNQIAAGGMEADIAKGRIATGVALGGMLSWMAVNDRMTGGSPKDSKERLLWESDGRQPYSIRITNPVTGKDQWLSYQWFEPLASIAGAVADSAQVFSYIHGDDEADTLEDHDMKLQEAISHIVGALIENVGNKTFMQGAAAFSEMYNDPKRAFSMWGDEMGSNLMPYSGLTKELRNMQDPYLRQAYSLLDKIKDDLPTAFGVQGSKTLPARLDFFGEPRTRQGGNSILGPLTPMPGSNAKNDPVLKELQSLSDQTRTVPITMPSKQLALMGNGAGLQDGQGMRLNPSEYNDYVRMSRNEPSFNNRTLNLRDKLEQMMQSPVYQKMTAAERVEFIKQATSTADKAGAVRLWNENDDFRDRMQAWTAEKNRLKFNQ